ncbi:ICE-like protease (caspase) p20 domain protein [Ceratobasidium sp. AG-Ba]|nr:ICE-like protease (caspase) p20 domain protein [Ceratobasidium sp. AG-Ba]
MFALAPNPRGKGQTNVAGAPAPVGPGPVPEYTPPDAGELLVDATNQLLEALHEPEKSTSNSQPRVLAAEDGELAREFEDKCRAGFWSGNIHQSPESLSHARRRALVPPSRLNGTYLDAYRINKLLVDKFGYSTYDICVLSDADRTPGDQDSSNLYPSKANIEKGLRWLSADTRAGDFRFLYYAGHGCRRIEAPPGANCEGIIPADVTYNSYQRCDSCECELKDDPSVDTLDPAWVIWDYKFNKILAESLADASNLTVVLDCCHSGGTLSRSFSHGTDALTAPTHSFARGNFLSCTNNASDTESTSTASAMKGNILYLPNRIDLGNKHDPAVAAEGEATVNAANERATEAVKEDLPDFDVIGSEAKARDSTGSNNPPRPSIPLRANCRPHRQGLTSIQDFRPGCRVLVVNISNRGKEHGIFVDHLTNTPNSTYRQLNRKINERFADPIPMPRGYPPVTQNPQLYASVNMGTGEGPGNRFEHTVEL